MSELMTWSDVVDRRIIHYRTDRWLTTGVSVVTIGSCFARNIGRYLSAIGLSVESPDWGNHYHAPAVELELRRALGENVEPCRWRDEKTGMLVDGRRHAIAAETEEALTQVELGLLSTARRVFMQAQVIIITLGISEIWEARSANGTWTALDQIPPEELVSRGTARCRFQTPAEVADNLHTIDELLGQLMPRRSHSIVTVSPIPLKRTFHGADIRISNARSKSTLIAAVHEFVAAAPEWSYFPAFEFFAHGGPTEGMWQRDGRHPTARAVTAVCQSFVESSAVSYARLKIPAEFTVPQV